MRHPTRTNALTMDDLIPGRQVTLHFPGGSVRLEILSEPFDQQLPLANARVFVRTIRVRNLTREGLEETRALGDMGVAPYSTGAWNDHNYVTAR